MISIITLIGLDNYGNLLQKYALNHMIKTLGFSAETEFCLKYTSKKTLILHMVNVIKFKLKFTKMCRTYNFLVFSNSLRNHYTLSNWRRKEVSYYICGSDQIWSPNVITAKVNGLDFFFASKASPSKRISYAASFGMSYIPDERKEEYKKYLSEMKAISVREESGAKIVKELIGKAVPVLIDPTLMLDKADWLKVSIKPKFNIPERYILTYFLGDVSQKRNTYIEKIAVENNMQIIHLEWQKPNDAWYRTGPAEFLWLIEHCSLLCTDSFHGSVFSIIMNVPFLVFDREDSSGDMSSRIDTLLSKFKLENRKYNANNQINLFEHDYEHIKPILSEERKKATNFLKNALEIN